jgi:hypothetical protein
MNSLGNKASVLADLMLGETSTATSSLVRVRVKEDTTPHPSSSSTTTPLLSNTTPLLSTRTISLLNHTTTRTRDIKLRLSSTVGKDKGDTTLGLSTATSSRDNSMVKDLLVDLVDRLSTVVLKVMIRDRLKASGARVKDKEGTSIISLLVTTMEDGVLLVDSDKRHEWKKLTRTE